MLVVLGCVGTVVLICTLESAVLSEERWNELGSLICLPLAFAASIVGGVLAARRASLLYASLALLVPFVGFEVYLLGAFGPIPLTDYAVSLAFRTVMLLVPGVLAAWGRRVALARRYASIPPPPGL